MAVKADAIHVENFAFVPVGSGKNCGNTRCCCIGCYVGVDDMPLGRTVLVKLIDQTKSIIVFTSILTGYHFEVKIFG